MGLDRRSRDRRPGKIWVLVAAAALASDYASCSAHFAGEFEIRSSNRCFRQAALYNRIENGGIIQRCSENNVTFCDTRNLITGTHHTTVTVTANQLTTTPSISTYLINICDDEQGRLPITTVQRFGFALQLYGPTEPFAISRSFCVGQSEADCCVFNLCNARFGQPGACTASCQGAEIELRWIITWNTGGRVDDSADVLSAESGPKLGIMRQPRSEGNGSAPRLPPQRATPGAQHQQPARGEG